MAKVKFLSSLLIGFGVLGASPVFAASAGVSSLAIAGNTPKFAATAKSLGAVNPSSVIEVSIWLKPHNRADLDATAKDLYNPASPHYRQWLSKSEFVQRYGPTEAEAKSVQSFFTSNGLKVVSVAPGNFFVRARGTVGQVNNAFHVTLNNYSVNGRVIRGNSKDPVVTGEAASLVGSISGLDTLEYSHPAVSKFSDRTNASTKAELTASAAASSNAALPFNSKCFSGQARETITSGAGYTPASIALKGNEYTTADTGCGYTPKNIQDAYGLKALYKEGFDGTGQTIVIIDWCGSPTIKADANAFSSQFGLPALTSSNFTITPTGPSTCSAPDPEINIDVEWAHAIAPGAAINLVVPPSATFQDVDEGYFYAVNYQLGSVISGSYGSEELYTPPTVLITEDLISEAAAVQGISANFSTGDSGDFTFDFPEFNPPSVSAPADSAYATGVGGVSLYLRPNDSIVWQAGWGTNVALVAQEGYVADPAAGNGFFNFGAGGGESSFFAKPSYQSALPGAGRQLPDISWLADPFTGAYIAISQPNVIPELQYPVYGGTSLACPMFSALWAIANQEAGVSLGQAAPYVYGMPASTITDIKPVGSKNNVTAKVYDASGITASTSDELVAPLEGTTTYISALWNYPLLQNTVELLTFGTDSGLTTGSGWDNVTGVGVPKPKAFADYFKP